MDFTVPAEHIENNGKQKVFEKYLHHDRDLKKL